MTVPIGTIMAYAGDNSGDSRGYLQEQGWLLCNGEQYPISDYPQLFHIIGTYYGTSTQSGGFVVPDLRGRFVRGVDHGAERDPDAAQRTPSGPGGNVGDHVGSVQKSKSGLVWNGGHMRGAGDYGAVFPDLPNDEIGESRPVNIYVNWIIKARDVG